MHKTRIDTQFKLNPLKMHFYVRNDPHYFRPSRLNRIKNMIKSIST